MDKKDTIDMKKDVIDFGELEKGICKVEGSLAEYNIEEKSLILGHVLARINMEKTKMKQQELTDNAMKGLSVKGLLKKLGKEEKE